MRQMLLVAFVVALSIHLQAESQLIPLVDPSDPILITGARLAFEDDILPVMIISVENQTDRVIDTGDIWLNTLRFYTKVEMSREGVRKLWDCGLGRWAADGKASRPIAPKARAELRLSLASNCQHNREHEHFSVEVSRIGRRFSEPMWERERDESARLLAAAMPHP